MRDIAYQRALNQLVRVAYKNQDFHLTRTASDAVSIRTPTTHNRAAIQAKIRTLIQAHDL